MCMYLAVSHWLGSVLSGIPMDLWERKEPKIPTLSGNISVDNGSIRLPKYKSDLIMLRSISVGLPLPSLKHI